MIRSKSLRRYIFKQFDFDFDFSHVSKEQNKTNLKKAIYLGIPFYDTCYHLKFNGEEIEEMVKDYVLSSLFEDVQTFTPRQLELMEQYSDQSILGELYGNILSELTFCDPKSWYQTFENAMVYLIDAGLGEAGLRAESTLCLDSKKQILTRFFGNIPLSFDEPVHDGKPVELWAKEWKTHAMKSGSAYTFFRTFLTKEQFLHPHPNDLHTNNKKIRMIKQHEHFKTILMDLASIQDITIDMRQYEGELHTGFLYYASYQIHHSGIYTKPTSKRKADAIVKITALLTLIRSPELRCLLLHVLLNDPPFNFIDDFSTEIEINEDVDIKTAFLYNDILKERQIALYISLICTIEWGLKLFLKDKMKEMISYFVHVEEYNLSIEDQTDAAELKKLHSQLAMYVLLRDCHQPYTKEKLVTEAHFNPIRYCEVPDEIFSLLYQWTYQINKEFTLSSLLRNPWRQWLNQNVNRYVTPVENITDTYEILAERFKDFARIKPFDLGCEDIEKILKDL